MSWQVDWQAGWGWVRARRRHGRHGWRRRRSLVGPPRLVSLVAFRRRRRQGLTIALLVAGLFVVAPLVGSDGRGPLEAVFDSVRSMAALAGLDGDDRHGAASARPVIVRGGEGPPGSGSGSGRSRGAAGGAIVSGQALVRDGDTIVVARTPVRLQGLHCPERGEPGGLAATSMMQGLVRGRAVSCRLNGERTHDRMVGRCEVGGQDLAASLIKGRVCARCARYDPFMRYLPSQLIAGPWSGSMPRYC